LIAKVARVHIIEITPILPALAHDLVLEYATQHYGLTAGGIVKISAVGYFRSGGLGQHVDVFICAILAEPDPGFHLTICMLHC
jgi:hypothetical protein